MIFKIKVRSRSNPRLPSASYGNILNSKSFFILISLWKELSCGSETFGAPCITAFCPYNKKVARRAQLCFSKISVTSYITDKDMNLKKWYWFFNWYHTYTKTSRIKFDISKVFPQILGHYFHRIQSYELRKFIVQQFINFVFFRKFEPLSRLHTNM